MYISAQDAMYEEFMNQGSALIGSDNINIEILSFDDEGYVFVDYSYNGKTIQARVPESCIYTMASEFTYDDFAPIPTPEPSNGQVMWNGDLIDEDDFPF